MPISSGASGRPSSARLHLPAGGQSSIRRNGSDLQVSVARFSPRKLISASDHALDQENRQRVLKTSTSSKLAGFRTSSKQVRANSRSVSKNFNEASEKYKQISHISAPSSNSTTSLLANKYFVNEANFSRQSESSNNNNEDENDFINNNQPEASNKPSAHPNQLCEDAQSDTADSNHKLANERFMANANNPAGSKSLSLLNSLKALGASHKSHQNRAVEEGRGRDRTKATMMKRGAAGQSARPSLSDAHYSTAATINEGPINPSMSPAFHISGKKLAGTGNMSSGRTPASSASNSTTNLHSLSSLHQQPATTTINRGFNLKYIKTLIIVLMSLDFLITIFVHNFASHDEFLIAFTKSKLRLSLVNLVASAVWFVVLSGAILFDIYFVLVVACMVDLASFIILLTCSVYHFTHRIDYNLVSMASLLLLLFSIIILHVYLIALTTLTIYLTLAVKRRRKH